MTTATITVSEIRATIRAARRDPAIVARARAITNRHATAKGAALIGAHTDGAMVALMGMPVHSNVFAPAMQKQFEKGHAAAMEEMSA